MSIDTRYSLYERLHFWEIDLRDKINNRLPVLLGIILALVGFESYLISKLFPLQQSCIGFVMGALLFISMLCLGISVCYLVRSWHGMEYALLPAAQHLEERAVEFREYCDSLPDCDDSEQCLATEIGRDMFQLYVTCGSHNHELNKLKSFRLHRAFDWILGSLGLAVATYILLMLSGDILKSNV